MAKKKVYAYAEKCWHFCKICRRDFSHMVGSTTPIDTWERPCEECIAAGKAVLKIKPQVTDVIPEECAEIGREKSPEGVESQESEEKVAEDFQDNAGVWHEALDAEGGAWPLARQSWDRVEQLRILHEREIIGETF